MEPVIQLGSIEPEKHAGALNQEYILEYEIRNTTCALNKEYILEHWPKNKSWCKESRIYSGDGTRYTALVTAVWNQIQPGPWSQEFILEPAIRNIT